jgi:hypothetical protein
VVSCTGNTLVFDAPHFSGYAAGGEESLTIDNNGPKYANETITFNATYTNTTDGSNITGADCNLSLWNGSSYMMGGVGDHYELDLNVTEAGTHDYNVTCSKAGFETITAFDTFTISGSPSAIDLYGANVTFINTSRYEDERSPWANTTTEEGNRTRLNFDRNVSTDRWAGFYGNVSAAIVIAQSADAQMLYAWAWNSSSGGIACASTGPTPPSTITGASYADIDAAWGFPPASTDSAANTFNNPNCSQRFGATNMSDAYYATTGYSGDFITCAWKSTAAPAKNDMLFCANITGNSVLYNGLTGDFEIIVPAEYGEGVYETYYFYMSLD